jgi:Glycosyltransferase family 87
VIARLRVLAERLESSRARLLIRALFIATAITLTFLPFVRFLHSGTDMDYRTWFDAGQTVLRGSEIYPHTQNFPFMYPPTCALLLAGPAFFGKPALILILTSLNTMAWILCIRFSSALISEPRVQNAPIVIANFILIPFVWSSYHLGQPSLVLLALMLGAFLSLRRDREILAGVLVGFAVAIKAFPLLAIFYLVYRRYWTAAISLVIALGILLCLLPIPFRGWHQTLNDARDWQRGMLRYEQGGIAQRPERGYSWKNQSIFGLANRLLRRVSADEEPNPPIYANLANLDFTTVNVIIIASALLIGFSFVVAMPRQRAPEGDAREFAALLILILIFTPLAFGYLFVWLMFPLALLLKRILVAEGSASFACLSIAWGLLVATGVAPHFAQIYGSLFLSALILYLALAVDLWRPGKTPGCPTH